ncbi:HTH-type transcriptional activator RhaR [Sphingobium sp. AntQ-1]|uniref:helix-turn-helix domain-containing protein n=1 Tax=Sphingobium TaxID=165695 RepID=UPI001A22D7A3|nr:MULTISPECIES: helix-turn-helix domain-containing protein [unclassified Sphingobium]MBJ7375732.1 helix-turn-helix domain-containing protein [Sphingobium sp.]WCP14001.1 HTH-type transcriptional activator RhaR [Sphingobium sp. AntQ-1]
MNGLQSYLLQSSSPFADRVEGLSSTATFDVKIHNTNWLEPGEGLFQSSQCFVQMFCNATRLVTGARAPRGHQARYVNLGGIAFFAKEEPMLVRWERGAQRSISCGFDIDQIASRATVEWNWPGFDWASALVIRNDHIAAMLRRVAAETVMPGFASSLQIETLLLGVAFELRRQFSGESAPEAIAAGKLSRAQLETLRAIAVDTPGEAPTIADLAEAIGMGGRKLAIRYRATTGQTLRSFLAESRLERARLLLPDQRLLIKQVAFDCGFKSSAAFAAAFHRSTGQTPQAFRGALLPN